MTEVLLKKTINRRETSLHVLELVVNLVGVVVNLQVGIWPK
jgi:hypothetical protein